MIRNNVLTLGGSKLLFTLVASSIVVLASMFLAVSPAQAVDTIEASTYVDTDGDGDIDVIRWDMDETVTACVYEAGDWTVNTASEMNLAITGLTCTGSNDILDITVSSDSNETGAATDPVISYANQGNADDVFLASAMGAHASQTITDAAAPTVVSVSPADGSTGSGIADNIVITFSEAMDTTFVEGGEYSISPDPGNFAAAAWTVSDTVVTLNPDNSLACNTLYTVTTAEGSIDAASGTPTGLVTTGAEDGDWSYSTFCGSSSSAAPTPPKTWEVMLVTPDEGESYVAGEKATIEWITGGTGLSNYVNLRYSTNSGITSTVIALNVRNTGMYTWTIPSGIDSDNVSVQVQTTDLVDILAEDNSNGKFTIGMPPVETPDPVVPDEPDETAPDTGDMGVSPVTGLPEVISEVSPGDYITSPSFEAVYYIDSNLKRHVFTDRQTYFTWQNSFDAVKTVTDATLSTLTIGTPMLPKHGTVLVKVQSVNKVYALDFNGDNALSPELRYIASEDIAKGLYGVDWADYVIDIPATSFSHFSTGPDVDSIGDLSVDLSLMKTRVGLNS